MSMSQTGEPRTVRRTPKCGLTTAELEGKNHLPLPAVTTLSNAAQDAIHLLGCEDILLAHVQLGCPPGHPRSFSAKLLSSCMFPSVYWCKVLFLPWGRTLRFLLSNFTRFLSAHFSSLLWSLWMAAQPCGISAALPSFVSLAHLQRVHSALSSRSFIKVLNRTGRSIYPC